MYEKLIFRDKYLFQLWILERSSRLDLTVLRHLYILTTHRLHYRWYLCQYILAGQSMLSKSMRFLSHWLVLCWFCDPFENEPKKIIFLFLGSCNSHLNVYYVNPINSDLLNVKIFVTLKDLIHPNKLQWRLQSSYQNQGKDQPLVILFC